MVYDRDFGFGILSSKVSLLLDDAEHMILSPLSFLREFENHWMLEIDLPLVNKKDIKVTFGENIINIEAKLKETYSEKKLGKISKYEYFKKSVSLPRKIDSQKAKAKFQKGRLEIKIAKKAIGKNIQIT